MRPIDPLESTLRSVELGGTVYFQANFQAPWGMAIPAKSVSIFHFVVRGEAWLEVRGEGGRTLRAGDVALLPRGDAHEIVHRRGGRARPAEEVLRTLEASSGAGAGDGAGDRIDDGVGGTPAESVESTPTSKDSTTLLCGHFDYDRAVRNALLDTLPRVVHVPVPDRERTRWMATVGQLAVAESEAGDRATSVVVDRLAEALLAQTLAIYLEGAEPPIGFLSALRDPQIGRALAELHRRLDETWTVEALARKAGLSRSAFAARFRELAGQSPMRYVADARLLEARRLLRRPGEVSLSTAQIAHRVGYASEFSLARAFKRAFGRGPGAERRRSSG